MDVRNKERARKEQERIREFLDACSSEVKRLFSTADRDQVRITAEKFNITTIEMVVILSRYTVAERLYHAIPLLATRNPGKRFTHKQLGAVVCTSRERVSKSLARLREEGLYGGEITNGNKE